MFKFKKDPKVFRFISLENCSILNDFNSDEKKIIILY